MSAVGVPGGGIAIAIADERLGLIFAWVPLSAVAAGKHVLKNCYTCNLNLLKLTYTMNIRHDVTGSNMSWL